MLVTHLSDTELCITCHPRRSRWTLVGVADRRADTERLVEARVDLRRLLTLAPRLTPDQRLVLFARVALDMSATEFCERHAWSSEKYRKIDQRGRAKLRLALAQSS